MANGRRVFAGADETGAVTLRPTGASAAVRAACAVLSESARGATCVLSPDGGAGFAVAVCAGGVIGGSCEGGTVAPAASVGAPFVLSAAAFAVRFFSTPVSASAGPAAGGGTGLS